MRMENGDGDDELLIWFWCYEIKFCCLGYFVGYRVMGGGKIEYKGVGIF